MSTWSTIALVMLATTATAFAGETPWQEVAPDVSMRLISSGKVSASGKTLMALEIDMPHSTKTYWRVPGESGLPMVLDTAGSTGISEHRMLWPYPLREIKSDLLDYVYYGHTVIPFELDVTDAGGGVDIGATLGICSDICIPAQASFSLPLTDPQPDRSNALRIRQALAEVPIEWTEEGEPVGSVTVVPGATAIAVAIDGDALDPTSIIAAGDSDAPLFGAPQKSPQSDLVVLPIIGKSDNSALEGLEVDVTFLTETGAYVVERTIEQGAIGDAANLEP